MSGDDERPRESAPPGSQGELTKIDARVTDDVAREYGEVETLWARPVGGEEYELRSVPLWTSGLAWGDVVTARRRSADERPLVDGVSRRGGHSTVMLAIEHDAVGKRFQRAWKPLAKQGCSWEGMSETLRTIDVPADADPKKVAKALEWGRVTEVWTYTVLHLADAHAG